LRRSRAHRFVEIIQRRGGDPVIAEAEVDLVQIQFEDPLLGIGGLDSHRKQDFPDFALDGAIRGQQEVLRHLLRDGRSALHMALPLGEHQGGAQHALGIETAVGVEILVLGGDERVLDQIRNRRRRQIETAFAGIFGQQAAVRGVDARHHRRLIVLELGVVGQILLVFVNHRGADRRRDHEHDRARGEEKTYEPADGPHAKVPNLRPR